MNKPILCVDFDGVIHSYTSGWQGTCVISDPPVKGAIEWLWKATEFWDVQIYSSRSSDSMARKAMWRWMAAHSPFGSDHPMSQDWKEGVQYPIKFADKKPSAFLTIDDRAICFEGDWHALDPAELLKFKPWNKRDFGKTGDFPRGAISKSDEGGLKMGIAYDPANGLVRVEFGTPVAWLALPPAQAIALAQTLLKHAGAEHLPV